MTTRKKPPKFSRALFQDFTTSLADYVVIRERFRRMKMEHECRKRLIEQLNAIISEHRKIVERIMDTWYERGQKERR